MHSQTYRTSRGLSHIHLQSPGPGPLTASRSKWDVPENCVNAVSNTVDEWRQCPGSSSNSGALPSSLHINDSTGSMLYREGSLTAGFALIMTQYHYWLSTYIQPGLQQKTKRLLFGCFFFFREFRRKYKESKNYSRRQLDNCDHTMSCRNLLRYRRLHIDQSMDKTIHNTATITLARALDFRQFLLGFLVCIFFGLFEPAGMLILSGNQHQR